MGSYSVKKPITVLMGILIIIVLGVFSVTRLPLTLFPDINLPFVVTITPYEGRTPEEVEAEVALKIESSVATIGNFTEVSSMSNEHFGISIITFADGANMDSVVIELRELLNNINFADGVGNTRILRISPDMLPVMTVTLFRDYDDDLSDEEALIRNTEWINRDILLDLTSIPGVADVNVSGAADIVLQVKLDQSIIDTYGITHQEVLEIIEAQNVGGLIGVALDSGEIRMLYLGDKPSNLSDIATLPILFDSGEVITLSDLIIEDGISYINANTEVYSKINGTQGIQVSFTKQSDYGITEVTESITTRLNEIMEREGETAHYSILLDQGEYINVAVGSVLQNIIVGGILAIIILFVFLRNIKPTLIVGLAIPISVIAAFMLMYFTDVSLNLVSMGGLALGIGMLVDNSIVVIENIYRMIGEGKSRKEAAIQGSKQVAGAITSSTLTTVAVFLPIVFIEGMIADIFISMALTIAFSLGASLVIALTLVPSMASRLLDDTRAQKEGKVIQSFKRVYKTSVLFTLKHKAITVLTVIFLLVASIWLVVAKGFIMLPTSDEGVIDISITTNTQTLFADKAEFADLLSNQLMEIDDIEIVSTSIGGSSMFGGFGMMGGGMSSSDSISLTINLIEDRKQTTQYYESYILDVINNFDFTEVNMAASQVLEVNVSAQNSTGAIGGAQGVNIKVSGYDLETLEIIANDITTILENIDGVEKADSGISYGNENVKISVDRTNAMTFGLTSQAVMDNVNFLFTNLSALGASQSLTVEIEGIEYVLELPSDAFAGGINFSVFGDYKNFLGGIQLFDSPTREMIEAYNASSEQGIYVLNAMLPGYVADTPIQFVVNPYLKVTGGELVMNPMSADPTLVSLALAPLFDETVNSVAVVDYSPGFATIRTDGSTRFVTVTAQIEDGKNVTLVSSDVTEQVNAYLDSTAFSQHGNGYNVIFQGENEEILQAVSDLTIAAIVAILLVYMVMAIQFQSLVYPFIILFTIPLAFTGGMLALLITNQFLSLVSIMGLIILIGVVVNNGIVLIDYINKLREDGRTVKDAIIEAGQTRLRPIFMTALTTILALLTMALGVGEGSELLQPMAITAIGGLIYATLLTLVVVPTIYAMLNSKRMKKEAEEHAVNQR